MIDWKDVGDGTVFTAQATAGPTPEEVWSSDTRIRDHYHQTIAYALEDLLSWVRTYGDDDLVVLALGDHQPAPLVSGDTANHEVPVHLIAHDPAVLDAVAQWQWSAGLRPDDTAPHWRMDALRDHLINAFSPPAHTTAPIIVSGNQPHSSGCAHRSECPTTQVPLRAFSNR
jgi:hypothetical protein